MSASDLLLRALGRLVLSPRAQRFAVLIYHRVTVEPDPLIPDQIDRGAFESQLRTLRTCFNVTPLSDAIERQRDGRLSPRTVCITFDDGYADNATVALPLLRENGCHATFFVATDYLDGGSMWNDRIIHAVRMTERDELDLERIGLGRFGTGGISARRGTLEALVDKCKYQEPRQREQTAAAISELAGVGVPQNLMMTSTQIRELADAGMELGGHTASHPILAAITGTEAEQEIANGRARLEEIAGAKVRLFAYPNGRPNRDYRRSIVELVRRLGFSAAVSTSWGRLTRAAIRFRSHATPWDRDHALRRTPLHNAWFTRPTYV
jgi:peptidoglycan/xylan/chitin deacetylase (PgdA/CDA1 family)